jgi:outer membrane immunogenic protein
LPSAIDPADPIDCDSFTEDGDEGDDPTWVAGAHIGFDKQIGSFVIGALLDANWIDHDNERSLSFDPDVTEPGAFQRPLFPEGAFSLPGINEVPEEGRPFQEFSEGSSLNWYGTARARAGFAAGRFLIYGTGGLSFGDYESEASQTAVFTADEADRVFGPGGAEVDEFDPVNDVALLPEGCAIGPAGTIGLSDGEPGVTCTSSESDDEMLFGYALGAGVDVLLTDNFSIGAEYLYVNLGDADFDAFGSFDGDEGDVDFQTIMVKGSFRFGG